MTLSCMVESQKLFGINNYHDKDNVDKFLPFKLERGRTDRLDARSVLLWIRSAEPPGGGELCYEDWAKESYRRLKGQDHFKITISLHLNFVHI